MHLQQACQQRGNKKIVAPLISEENLMLFLRSQQIGQLKKNTAPQTLAQELMLFLRPRHMIM